MSKDDKIQELKERIRVLEERIAELEPLAEMLEMKDRFFSIIGHDLRNPFNTIISFTNLMLNSLDDFNKEDIERHLHILNESATHGHDLLENLLSWSRTQTGEQKVRPNKFDLSLATDLNIELFYPMAKSKNIKLSSLVKPKTYIFADENMIHTIVRNLISNAIKFTPPGGKVRMWTREKDSCLLIAVSDTGIGMDQEQLSKLFRPDHSISRPGTNEEKGTGLGLLVCKEFVELNHGQIEVNSEPRKGTTFCVKLPLYKD